MLGAFREKGLLGHVGVSRGYEWWLIIHKRKPISKQ